MMTYKTSYSLKPGHAPFAANTVTSGDQAYTALAPLETGGFVVAYGSMLDFWGADYKHIGTAVAAEGSIESIAAFENGNSAVLVRDGTDDRVQVFDNGGHQVGATIDIFDFGSDANPQIAALSNRSFAIAFESDNNIYFDEYDSTGQTIVSTVQVDALAPGVQSTFNSITSLADGGFVVSYSDQVTDGGVDLRATVFNANGSVRLADHVLAGADSAGVFEESATVALPSGGFAVAYRYVSSANDTQILIRAYDQFGAEVGIPHVIASGSVATELNVSAPQIAVLGNGFITVGWSEFQSGVSGQFLSIFNEDGVIAKGLPTHVAFSGEISSLINGQIFFAQTDAAIDHSGTGVSVSEKDLTRISTGTAGADPFNGDLLNDLVHAGGGADKVSGGGGNDSLYGEAGNDNITGGVGGDLIDGGDDNDRLDGGTGLDSLTGGKGNDTYVLGDFTAGPKHSFIYDSVSEARNGGVDTVLVASLGGARAPTSYTLGSNVENGTVTGNADFALSGNDLANALIGNTGANTLNGVGGNDVIDGGGGSDRLAGGIGNDAMTGSAGNDRLTGDAGADRFVFADVGKAAGGWGKDIIIDFTDGTDRIDFSGARGIDSFGDLTISKSGANVIIATGGGDQITLLNFSKADLSAGDFVFHHSAAPLDAIDVERGHFAFAGTWSHTDNALLALV